MGQSYNVNDSAIRNTAGTLMCQSKSIKGGGVNAVQLFKILVHNNVVVPYKNQNNNV